MNLKPILPPGFSKFLIPYNTDFLLFKTLPGLIIYLTVGFYYSCCILLQLLYYAVF